MRLARASRRPVGQVRFAHGEAEHAHHGGPAPYGVSTLFLPSDPLSHPPTCPLAPPLHLQQQEDLRREVSYLLPYGLLAPVHRLRLPVVSLPSSSRNVKGESTNLMCSLGGSRVDRPLHERVISYCECTLRTRHRV